MLVRSWTQARIRSGLGCILALFCEAKTIWNLLSLQFNSDGFPSCGGYFDRDLEKTMSQIEGWQQVRKGQSLPPELDVKIS
jgi:hypothetical protein